MKIINKIADLLVLLGVIFLILETGKTIYDINHTTPTCPKQLSSVNDFVYESDGDDYIVREV